MALITKMLGIAANDFDAGRINVSQFYSILQEAIDNGDILEPDNEFYVVSIIMPLIDQDKLQSSQHVEAFESRMNAEASAYVKAMKRHKGEGTQSPKRGWKFWK